MRNQSISRIVGFSIVGVVVIMGLIYDFKWQTMYISNALFVIGIFIFFLGIIRLTGAQEIFDSSKYLTHRAFGKEQKAFKTYEQYKDYLGQKGIQKSGCDKSIILISIGGLYVIISLVLGYM